MEIKVTIWVFVCMFTSVQCSHAHAVTVCKWHERAMCRYLADVCSDPRTWIHVSFITTHSCAAGLSAPRSSTLCRQQASKKYARVCSSHGPVAECTESRSFPAVTFGVMPPGVMPASQPTRRCKCWIVSVYTGACAWLRATSAAAWIRNPTQPRCVTHLDASVPERPFPHCLCAGLLACEPRRCN